VEKLALLRWRRPDDGPDTDDLLAAADRLCRAGHWVTAYVEHTGDAAAFRFGDDPDGHVLSSAATVWVDRVEQLEAVLDQLPTCARTTPYLLSESIPLEVAGRDWPDGVASPGVSLLTAFPRVEGLDDDTFFARWHGSHSKLTFEIHPVRRYVRNTVVRRLGDGPPADAVVTESFTVEDLLDPSRFYGVGEPDLPWREAIDRINADLATFCDLTRLQTAPTEEILLASAPWER
jgi:hypothetical protein